MTEVSVGLLILRLTVGGIFVAQGWRKLLMPEHVSHGRAALRKAIHAAGVPFARAMALVVAALELSCGTLLLLGLATRLAAVPLCVILLMAIRVKWTSGFFGGWDWPLSVSIGLMGGGWLAVDSALLP